MKSSQIQKMRFWYSITGKICVMQNKPPGVSNSCGTPKILFCVNVADESCELY